jgi:mRNA-degrading endonuclease RelE of RelBE toxin-antitoxin system
MVVFISTKQFDKKYEELSNIDQKRIKDKLQYLTTHPNIFSVIRKLNEFKEATHRVRIGNFRIVLKLIEENKNVTTFLLIKIGHRREIYK